MDAATTATNPDTPARGDLWAGLACGALVTMPTSLAEFAVVAPAVCFLPRIVRDFGIWKRTAFSPAALSVIGLYAWLAIGLLWSPDPEQGVSEIGTFRFFLAATFLSPILAASPNARVRIIASVCFGFLIGHAVQGLNAWALHAGGPEALRFGRDANRMSGWWDPAVAGTILTAALGLHLPKALMGAGRARWIALAGVCVTLAGLAMTGSRGGWLASAALLAITALIAVGRAYHSGAGRRTTLATLAGLAVVLACVGFVLRGPIGERVGQVRGQVSAALAGEVTGDTGARIAMKQEALAAFLAHPIAGVGTGGYASWVIERRGEGEKVAHGHAHDTPLHAAASNGLIGLGLLGLAFVFTLRDAWRHAHRAGLGTYAAGPLFAMLGLALTAPFDTLHVSATAAAVTGMVFALCLDRAPRTDRPPQPV